MTGIKGQNRRILIDFGGFRVLARRALDLLNPLAPFSAYFQWASLPSVWRSKPIRGAQ